MPVTPDRAPGPSSEEELQLEDQGFGATPSVVGGIIQADGVILGRDVTGVYDLRSGSGLSEAGHEALDTLTHGLSETHDVLVTRTSGKVSEVLAEVPAPDGTNIRKFEVLTRSGGQVATYRVTQYESDGTTVKRQLDATVNRSGGKVTSVNVTRTV